MTKKRPPDSSDGQQLQNQKYGDDRISDSHQLFPLPADKTAIGPHFRQSQTDISQILSNCHDYPRELEHNLPEQTTFQTSMLCNTSL